MSAKYTVQQVEDAIRDAGGDFYERYSGRGMYGDECPGIEADNEAALLTVFVEIASEDLELARTLAKSARFDSMGRGMICYWPHITYPKEVEGAE